jgi:hypothetical protein
MKDREMECACREPQKPARARRIWWIALLAPLWIALYFGLRGAADGIVYGVLRLSPGLRLTEAVRFLDRKSVV